MPEGGIPELASRSTAFTASRRRRGRSPGKEGPCRAQAQPGSSLSHWQEHSKALAEGSAMCWVWASLEAAYSQTQQLLQSCGLWKER